MDSVTIGLDIGSSGVRAAEIDTGQNPPVLRHYGQIGLPPGAVSDGEIINTHVVSSALRRLWTEVGFSTNKVVVGVSGPRVMVRQADVPALDAADLRSSLKFDAQELIPIPMDDATFDFSILDDSLPSSDGKPMMRILMAAAHKEVLRQHLDTLKDAGLEAIALDPTPLALMRAVPGLPTGASGLDVIVSIGADLTTVGVREAGVPRFIRSLTVGGAKLTETIANTMHMEVAVAERLKRGDIPPDAPQLPLARKAMSVEMRELAEDVRATVDFFLSQASDQAKLQRLLVTGGAAQTEGLAAAIGNSLPVQAQRIDPFAGMRTDGAGLDPSQLARSSASAATAVGLALWRTDSALRLSVLPPEVAEARTIRKIRIAGATAVAGVAAILALGAAGQILHVRAAQHKVADENAQVTALNTQVSQLTAATAAHGKVSARAALVESSLTGDVDWVRLFSQLAGVMPTNLALTNMSANRVTNASSSSTTSGPAPVGSMTFTVKGTGGLPTVEAWLKQLDLDPDLTDTFVGGISVQSNGGVVQFSSTTQITQIANSDRAQKVTDEYSH